MRRLLLVRHGESVWNATPRLQGHDRGLAQTDALAPLVARMVPDHVRTSDLQRALATADRLGHAYAVPAPRLREIGVGDWTGSEIAALDPATYQDWRAGTFAPPGGYVWADFRTRVCAAVTDIAMQGHGTVLFVCHGGVIRALIDGGPGLPPARLLPVGPASLTVIGFRQGQARFAAMSGTADGLSLDAPD
ncbi:probable phosphoglycerate mutase [Loktanella fryxellensis]|uniref:Probable phosphoglycerate mutase n=1 Tax=Loktanella fryxellensis TaxID=245187 RepID=A0A1H8B409_9RHOB|nr:histidine phosphatase family protein [Loktanella fryxellensis]SEM77476.1 probable phosphoglycerate mutase [Loktanella fryxellensis]